MGSARPPTPRPRTEPMPRPALRFSRRTDIARRPHALARAVARAQAEGRPLLDLTVSNPTRVGLDVEDDWLPGLADPRGSRYEPHPFGLPAARRAVAARLGVEAERVLLSASTSEAYGWLFTLLCDPGDEVLVPAPSYPLLEHLARFASVRLVPYRLHHAEGWFADLDSLRAGLGPRTRAALVVQPNNPTGSYVSPELWSALAGTGLPVIADEVFRPYPLSARGARACRALQAAERFGVRLLFALDGLSKRCGLPQLKAAWCTVGGTDADAVEEALGRLELLADAHLSVATPVQLALPELLEAGERRRAAIASRLAENLGQIRSMLRGSAMKLLEPDGGWYAMVRLPRTRSEEAWALAALEGGVLVQPGWFYDVQEGLGPMAVLSLLTPPGTWREGIERLVQLTRHG